MLMFYVSFSNVSHKSDPLKRPKCPFQHLLMPLIPYAKKKKILTITLHIQLKLWLCLIMVRYTHTVSF